jgi:serine/threonine protein kinase
VRPSDLSVTDDLIGDVIDGKYKVEQQLGRGGMGAVYRATHLGTDRRVALKVIHAALADDPGYLARFRREARACGRLHHPNIVDVTDFNVCQHGEGPLAYLVMEYLDGCTLGDVLANEPVPPVGWTIDILEQVSSAVEVAHRENILHRDLKPDNIWLEPNRRGGYSVKVLDFGLAKMAGLEGAAPDPAPGRPLSGEAAADDTALDVTFAGSATAASPVGATMASDAGALQSTSVAGTPAYMAPEQVSGGTVTASTDVYSLGVIAYRMLSGREPFAGTIRDVLHAHLHTAPPPLSALNPRVPDDAAALVMSALAKDPAARPASAGRFGNMLAGRLETPGAITRKGIALFLDRLPIVLTIGTACFLPALIWSVGLALWAVVSSWTAAVPPPAGLLALPAHAIFILLIGAGAFALNVMPVVVLHAVAAPQRPIDLTTLRRAYRARVETWVAAIWPKIWPQLLALMLMLVAVTAMAAMRPWIRSFERPMRVAIILATMLPYVAVQWWAMRRMGTGLQNAMFVGPAMLVEGLSFEEARARALSLASAGSKRQRRGRVVLMIAMGLVGALGGLLSSRARVSALTVATLAPLFTIFTIVALSLMSQITSLMYFTARRTTGESIDQAFADFERAVLPDTHWQRSHRERVMDQLSSAKVTEVRGS